MRPDILFKIRSDNNLHTFIKYHSFWYKELTRNPDKLNKMIDEMKKEYKLTTSDKIEQLSGKIQMIKTFMDVLN